MPRRDFSVTKVKAPEQIPTETVEQEIATREEALLIDETINEIKGIFDKNLTDTYIEIGKLIIKKIYSNDLDSIDFSKGPKKKNAHKWAIFKSLTEEVEKRSDQGEGLPKKTWLYNAVRLVKDQTILADCPEYIQLSISHKIALLPVDTKKEKIALINKTIKGKLSVRDMREIVYNKMNTKAKDLLFYIKNLDELTDMDRFFTTRFDALSADIKSRKAAIKECHKRKVVLELEISAMNERKAKLEMLTERLNSIETPGGNEN